MRARFAKGSVVVGCLALAAACTAVDRTHDVDITAPDGVVLKASYHSPGKPGPAVLLFHQCSTDRHSWDRLTTDLTAAGFHVLAFDQRGWGASGGQRTTEAQTLDGDADAAYAYLRSRKDVDTTRIAAGGSSCGVAQAADLAARHPEVRALVLLSGPANPVGVAYIEATPALSVFGAASMLDSSGSAVRDVITASGNPNSKLKMYHGTDHGIELFDKVPTLRPAIVTWLQEQLRE